MPGCTYFEQKDERCERHQGARIPGAGEALIHSQIVEDRDNFWVPAAGLAPPASNRAVAHT